MMAMPQHMMLCQYRYDPLDRCVSSTSPAQASTQRFYQKSHLATEIQGSSHTCVFQYGDLLLAEQGSVKNATRLLATDQQHSVITSISAQQYSVHCYTPYGHRKVQSGLGSLLGFNGGRPDPITGHYLLGNGHRAYNPILMRFNSPDSLSPFGEGGINTYAYCSGDPVNWQDSTGLSRFSSVTRILSVLGAAAEPPSPKKGFLSEAVELAQASLVRRGSAPASTIAEGRLGLQEGLKSIPKTQSFTKLLSSTNDNLIFNGDKSLSVKHARSYLDLAEQVERGTISNSSAHFRSAQNWASNTRGATRVVGTVFNLAAGVVSGGAEHANLKTGRTLRDLGTGIRR